MTHTMQNTHVYRFPGQMTGHVLSKQLRLHWTLKREIVDREKSIAINNQFLESGRVNGNSPDEKE